MAKENLYLGKTGEELALGLLQNEGYKIICKNYKNKLGEVDIIAKEKDVFCFIEVKTRQTDRFGMPEEAVTIAKQRKISQVALQFIKENRLLDKKARFDVVSVIIGDWPPRLNLIKNAFELSNSFTY